MIETPFTFLSVLTLIASSLVYLEYKFKWRVFNILPSIGYIILFSYMGSFLGLGNFLEEKIPGIIGIRFNYFFLN